MSTLPKSLLCWLILPSCILMLQACEHNSSSDTSPDSHVDAHTSDKDMGDSTTGMDTDRVDPEDIKTQTCGVHEHVFANMCKKCAPGSFREAGDQIAQGDTTCEAILCKANEHVQDHTCITCASGETNAAGDDASGSDTTCDAAILCKANEHVQDHTCITCAPDETNAAGDDALGEDTACDDACFSVLGVSCLDFEQAYLKASNTDDDDEFGHSVALYEHTLVVGVRFEDSAWADNTTQNNTTQSNNDTTDSGAVYVFTRDKEDSTWTQQAYIKASSAKAYDEFGHSVSLYKDTLAVSAPGEDTSGAVYVFTRTQDSMWVQQAHIKAFNADADDAFGHSVSLYEDTLVVGAHLEDSALKGVHQEDEHKDEHNTLARNSGAVYVFTRDKDSMWAQQAYIKASNTDAHDKFGSAVSLHKDTLVVSAPDEDGDATQAQGKVDQNNNLSKQSGAVYVFTRDKDSMWAQQAYIKASNTDAYDRFGYAISLYKDTLVVGAPDEASDANGINKTPNNNSAYNGAVYVFTRDKNSIWEQQAYIKASNPDQDDWFGYSVSLYEDTLAVGAPHESSDATGIHSDQEDYDNNNAQNSGAVYVFTRQGSMWTQQAYIKASNTDADDNFGHSVSLYKDTVIIGAPDESSDAVGTHKAPHNNVQNHAQNNNAPKSGAVYARKIAP